MGLFDNAFGQPSGLLGELPPWMTLRSGDSSVLPSWLQQIIQQGGLASSPQAQPPPQPDALPPSAQPAMLSPQIPQAEPRKSIFDPPDSYPGAPPLDRPFGPAMGAPQMPPPPRQPPGMSAMAQAPMGQPQQPSQGGPSMLGGIGNFLGDVLTRGPLGAISSSIDTSRRQQTYDALVNSGVDPKKAWFIMNSPEAGKLSGVLDPITKPELKETGSDPISGQKSYQVWDARTQTLRPVNGGAGNTQSGAGVPAASLLAPGVAALDHSLSGDAYLAQFGPEVQAAVKAYIAGDVMPSGNPRQQGVATVAKTIAQKYGQDMGIPVSDSLYSQRRTYRSQLGSNTPNSAGGQAKAFNQGIEHMGALADQLEKLNNSNGLGIPIIASAVNAVRQETSTEQAAIATHAANIGQTLAGEVGKLFSGSAGGGVHERQMTRERFDTVKSKPQLAAALEATLETMRGGLTALEQRRDEVLGPNSGVRFVSPETEAKIAKIEDAIARLSGKPGAPAAPSSAGGAPAAPMVATTPVAPPKIDTVIDGYRFRGGDPADKKNWQKVQ